jgi:tetratricopeptide (TPR) repeat protein
MSFRQRHVRVFLHDTKKPPSEGVLTLRPEGVIVDYFPTGREVFRGNISRDEFVSMYYLNIAADMISTKNYNQAFHFVLSALEKAPDNPDALNMLAIVHRRAGYSEKAEEIYQYAISQQPDNVVLLKNYRQLLLNQFRLTEASAIESRLSGLDDPSPLNWLTLAEEAYQAGEYRQAIAYFDKAIKLAPYLHNPYFGKAKSYFKLGKTTQAEQSLQLARQYSKKDEQSQLYERKLIALKTVRASEQ